MVASVICALCYVVVVVVLAVFAAVFLLSTEVPSLRTLYRTLGRDVRAFFIFMRITRFAKGSHFRNQTILDHFKTTLRARKDSACFIYQDQKWTYRMVELLSNRVANFFRSRGFSKGDEVALLLENCPEYVCIWLGLAKIGVVTALINTNLKNETLAHSINSVNVKAVVFGNNFAEALRGATEYLKGDAIEFFCFHPGGVAEETVDLPSKSLNALIEDASIEPVRDVKINFIDKVLYIYTSGTTGMPKAANIGHGRLIWFAAAAKYLNHMSDSEIILNPLPMYHSAGGLLCTSAVLAFGATMVLQKKFSASKFWKEAVKHRATMAQYIGETCRYLLNQPVTAEETQHCIKAIFGNGLRKHIWTEFQERFLIPHIYEFYGSTEGNANLSNMFGKVGAVGFLPKTCDRIYPVNLIKVDPETGAPARDSRGLCMRCKPGETGEIVGKIINHPINAFHGYVNKSDTQKKLIQNCFGVGDTAFLSGDLMVMDEDGYVFFVDRTGDTFRWRGENVSTGEVENVLGTALDHADCVVYGVEIPNVEGRAGMVTVRVDPKSIDFSKLYESMSKRLPPYAIPLFIRVSSEIEVTGTYKFRKVTLQKEGFNPTKLFDPIFFVDHSQKTYVPLTESLYLDIVNGKVKL